MLNNAGFALWADGYDKSAGLSDENGTYPFAGYRDALNRIYKGIMSKGGKSVLDIGFGSGTLTTVRHAEGSVSRRAASAGE